MKKLNLKLGGIKEMLGREQMKKVVGGYGYGYDGGDNCYAGGCDTYVWRCFDSNCVANTRYICSGTYPGGNCTPPY